MSADRLFAVEHPGTQEGKSFLEEMNPDWKDLLETWNS